MKVKARRSEYVDVDISTHEISELIRRGEYAELSVMFFGVRMAWCKQVGHDGDVHIKDGKWFVDSECGGGSHSWTSTDETGRATKAEMEIWGNFEKLLDSLKPHL